MELYDFTKLLKELVEFYERKEPKQATIELWFDKVKRIPAEPLKWVIKKIEDEHDSFPKNMPGAIWRSYTEWQQAHPEKIVNQYYFDCPDCNEGLIFATKKKNNSKYSYVFRCTRCRQNTSRAYPVSSRLELLKDYDVMPKEGNLNNNTTFKSLKEITNSIGGVIQ